jgi:hypothetical protein
LKEALIGSQSLFSDSSALLADISHPSAATRIADLCEQLVIVSTRLVLLHTAQPKDTWELRLTELVREDARTSTGRVHWRKSGHGGRVFAKPLALDIQVRAARAKAHPHASRGIEHDPSLSSMIVIRGVLGADPAKLIEDLMGVIAARTRINLNRGACERTLRAHQWREIVDGAGQCTGAVRVVLASLAEVQLLDSVANAMAVEINGFIQQVEVHNSFLVPAILGPAAASAASSSNVLPQPGNGNGSLGTQAALLPGPPGLI